MGLASGRTLFAMLVLLAAAACTGENGRADGGYSLPLTREFPSVAAGDPEALAAALRDFLASPPWVDRSAPTGDWDFQTIAVLTRDGARAGVYGDALFDAPVALKGPLTFVRCGRPETWRLEGGGSFLLSGFHVRLLDGAAAPHHVLPLNDEGELPSLGDIQHFTGAADPCPGPRRSVAIIQGW